MFFCESNIKVNSRGRHLIGDGNPLRATMSQKEDIVKNVLALVALLGHPSTSPSCSQKSANNVAAATTSATEAQDASRPTGFAG